MAGEGRRTNRFDGRQISCRVARKGLKAFVRDTEEFARASGGDVEGLELSFLDQIVNLLRGDSQALRGLLHRESLQGQRIFRTRAHFLNCRGLTLLTTRQ